MRSLATSSVALAIVVLLVAGAAAAIGWFPRETTGVAQAPEYPPLTPKQRADLEQWWALQPKVDLPIPSGGAKVLIVKFSDYMCPACRQTYEWYQPVLGKYLSGTPEVVKRAAREVGGIEDFDAQYQRALQEVKSDASLGGLLKITSTPTFFIGGRRLPGPTLTPPQYFDSLIELALRDAK